MADIQTQKSKVTTLDDVAPTAAVKIASAAADDVVGENHDSELTGDKVTLTVFPSPGEGGQEDVFVGHNGFAYKFKRGIPHRLPKEVAQVVADAIVTDYQIGSGGVLQETRTPRYAFSIIA